MHGIYNRAANSGVLDEVVPMSEKEHSLLDEAKHLASAIKTSAESRSNKGPEQRRSGNTGADAHAIVATARAACSCTASKQLGSLLLLANRFKTTRCAVFDDNKRSCNFGEGCVFMHGEGDRRRNPLDFEYDISPCPYGGFAGGFCPQGDKCRYSHTRTEIKNHPLTLLRQLQNDPSGNSCLFAKYNGIKLLDTDGRCCVSGAVGANAPRGIMDAINRADTTSHYLGAGRGDTEAASPQRNYNSRSATSSCVVTPARSSRPAARHTATPTARTPTDASSVSERESFKSALQSPQLIVMDASGSSSHSRNSTSELVTHQHGSHLANVAQPAKRQMVTISGDFTIVDDIAGTPPHCAPCQPGWGGTRGQCLLDQPHATPSKVLSPMVQQQAEEIHAVGAADSLAPYIAAITESLARKLCAHVRNQHTRRAQDGGLLGKPSSGTAVSGLCASLEKEDPDVANLSFLSRGLGWPKLAQMLGSQRLSGCLTLCKAEPNKQLYVRPRESRWRYCRCYEPEPPPQLSTLSAEARRKLFSLAEQAGARGGNGMSSAKGTNLLSTGLLRGESKPESREMLLCFPVEDTTPPCSQAPICAQRTAPPKPSAGPPNVPHARGSIMSRLDAVADMNANAAPLSHSNAGAMVNGRAQADAHEHAAREYAHAISANSSEDQAWRARNQLQLHGLAAAQSQLVSSAPQPYESLQRSYADAMRSAAENGAASPRANAENEPLYQSDHQSRSSANPPESGRGGHPGADAADGVVAGMALKDLVFAMDTVLFQRPDLADHLRSTMSSTSAPAVASMFVANQQAQPKPQSTSLQAPYAQFTSFPAHTMQPPLPPGPPPKQVHQPSQPYSTQYLCNTSPMSGSPNALVHDPIGTRAIDASFDLRQSHSPAASRLFDSACFNDAVNTSLAGALEQSMRLNAPCLHSISGSKSSCMSDGTQFSPRPSTPVSTTAVNMNVHATSQRPLGDYLFAPSAAPAVANYPYAQPQATHSHLQLAYPGCSNASLSASCHHSSGRLNTNVSNVRASTPSGLLYSHLCQQPGNENLTLEASTAGAQPHSRLPDNLSMDRKMWASTCYPPGIMVEQNGQKSFFEQSAGAANKENRSNQTVLPQASLGETQWMHSLEAAERAFESAERKHPSHDPMYNMMAASAITITKKDEALARHAVEFGQELDGDFFKLPPVKQFSGSSTMCNSPKDLSSSIWSPVSGPATLGPYGSIPLSPLTPITRVPSEIGLASPTTPDPYASLMIGASGQPSWESLYNQPAKSLSPSAQMSAPPSSPLLNIEPPLQTFPTYSSAPGEFYLNAPATAQYSAHAAGSMTSFQEEHSTRATDCAYFNLSDIDPTFLLGGVFSNDLED